MLPEIAERQGADIRIMPCLLGGVFKATGNQTPLQAFKGVKGKLDYEFLEMRRFAERHGLTRFRMNPHFPFNSLTVMRGCVAVMREGDVAPYIRAVAKAMWEDEKNLADPETIAEVWTGAGYDAADLLAKAQSEPVKTALKDMTAAAVERGVFGLPTFFVGDEMFFGKERLGQIEDALRD